MYSYDGPVIEERSGFFATGTVIVETNPVLSVPAEPSQPLHTIVYPRGIRSAFASSVLSAIEPGSFPPDETRRSAAHVLRPRFGGSYITLWAPRVRSIGFKM